MAETAFALLTPSNNSGALGLARATLDGTTLRVDVVASGLTPGQVHPFHLHGFLDDRQERAPVAADDTDGDGRGETAEGEANAYGPVIAGLTRSGNAQFGLEVSPDFPAAAADGTLRFSQTYALNPADAADDARILERLNARFEGRFLEFHGLDQPPGAGAGTPGEVNGTGGYIAALPVAAGPLLGAEGAVLNLATAFLGGTSSADFLDRGAEALSLLAPYTLRPTGGGPVAPEPPGNAVSPTDTYVALLTPSNNSGAVGAAVVRLDQEDTSVTVDLAMAGLEPGQVHASHIHGFASDVRSLLPNFRLDLDGDGFVEDQEGEAVVGPVILALTTDGSISDAVLAASFPVADAAGNLYLRQVYDFDTADPAQRELFGELEDRLGGREVQVHGLTLPATQGEGTTFEVNGEEGYKPNLPVANGILLPVKDADTAQDIVAVTESLERAVASEPGPIDWEEVAGQVLADFLGSGQVLV
jgi:hypothetical protein